MNLPEPTPFNDEIPAGSAITLNVCQGIGDIIWVYQKFAPYFDVIDFNILFVCHSDSSGRAVEWLKLLPKVRNVKMIPTYGHEYRALAERPCSMRDAVEVWTHGEAVPYACNKWLEEGVRLEDIDPESKLLWDIQWKSQPFKLPFENYAVLYVSGDARHEVLNRDKEHHLWTLPQWVEYVRLLWDRWSLKLPIVVIGAEFDRKVTEPLCEMLKRDLFTVEPMIGESPAKVIHLLKNAELFSGYQSGLNVVADTLGTKAVMMYFPKLGKMLNSWCQPGNAGTKFFADTFDSTPAQVVDKHRLFNPIRELLGKFEDKYGAKREVLA